MAFITIPWTKISLRIIMISAITFLIACFNANAQGLEAEELSIKRSDFPLDFMFGVATSALQIEGSANQGGRTPSLWDTFSQIPGKIKDGSNPSNAIDSYRRYKEDIEHIKDVGSTYYRFSISWTRILPKGTLKGGVNQEGIDYYNSLIDKLLRNGITPFVTILHFDSPQALEDKYGGFLSRSIVDDFKDYCEVLFETFGDRVKNWITINEPFVVALGYDLGKGAPGRCSLPPPFGPCQAGNSSTEPYIIGHNSILAHATAAKLYKEKYQAKQGGQIGIVLLGEFSEPYDPESSDDRAASERYLDFLVGWYMEPLVFGDYPKTMKCYVKERLPAFTEQEKKLVKGSFDFVGINYYTSRYAKQADHPPVAPHYLGDSLVNATALKDGVPIGPQASSGYIFSYPQGLQKLLEFMKEKYQNPTIYITENGIPEVDVPGQSLTEAINDPYRIKFILQHLYYTNKALKNGVKVKGYFYWALFDDFEWQNGYVPRFGLYYIDYNDNYRRIPKQSAKWLRGFLNGESDAQLFLEPSTGSPAQSPTPQPFMVGKATGVSCFHAAAAATAVAFSALFVLL